jgi:hypothetical protein
MIADLLLANKVNQLLECNSCFMVALNPKECSSCQRIACYECAQNNKNLCLIGCNKKYWVVNPKPIHLLYRSEFERIRLWCPFNCKEYFTVT